MRIRYSYNLKHNILTVGQIKTFQLPNKCIIINTSENRLLNVIWTILNSLKFFVIVFSILNILYN